jgi:hypothetical protein
VPTDRSNLTAARAWPVADVDGASSLRASAVDFALSPLDPVHHAPLFDPDQIQTLIESDDEARARLGTVTEIEPASPGVVAPPSTSADDRHVPTLTNLSGGASAPEVNRMTSTAHSTHWNGSSRSTAETSGTTTPLASSTHRRAADAAGNKSIDGAALHDDAGHRVAADSARAALGASASGRDARFDVLNPEADMTGLKPWYLSKTNIVALIGIAAFALKFYGYVVTPEDQAQLSDLIWSIGGIVSQILVIVFRSIATERVVMTTPSSNYYGPRAGERSPYSPADSSQYGDGEPTRSVPDAADLNESDFKRIASDLERRIAKSGIRNTTSSGSTDRSQSAAGRNGALLVGAVLLVSVGAGCANLDALYVDADRATYEAIAPEYLDYVAADLALDADAKASRRDTVGLWQSRIRTATESPP